MAGAGTDDGFYGDTAAGELGRDVPADEAGGARNRDRSNHASAF
jgi:hypothetical protein